MILTTQRASSGLYQLVSNCQSDPGDLRDGIFLPNSHQTQNVTYSTRRIYNGELWCRQSKEQKIQGYLEKVVGHSNPS